MAPVRKARKTKPDAMKPSSFEDGGCVAHINSQCGRPMRRSAGRKSLDSGFLNPDDALTESDHDLYIQDEDDRVRIAAKRKRSPSPPVTPPHIIGQDDNFGSGSVCDFLERSPRRHNIPPISLTFNVPSGHQGPFVVNLDLNSLLSQAQSVMSPLTTRCSSRSRCSIDSGYSSKSSTVSEQSKPLSSTKRGFLDLPAEIRNQIYRLAFVSKEKLDFAFPNNFSRSSSLLQTCRQVHEEGRSILYSENVFYLQRRRRERALRWTTSSYEIGYKDIRFFLKSVGAVNISLVKHIVVLFEDAAPAMNTHLKDADDRRFTCDEDLIDTLRLLADHSMLKTLDLCFAGRRQFYSKDEPRFVEYLTRIQADSVNSINNPDTPFSGWKGATKINKLDAEDLTTKMTRSVPMFG